MTMQRHPDDRFAAVLGREARRERPAFSSEFHGRLTRRLAARSAAGRRPAESGTVPRRAAGRGVPLAGGLAAVLLAVAALRPLGTGERPEPVVDGARSPAAVRPDTPQPEQDPAFVVERFPLFDEIDEEIRAGVVQVASSLLEVPDWRGLTEFDAAGFLGIESGR
jgi:hypothetical protein